MRIIFFGLAIYALAVGGWGFYTDDPKQALIGAGLATICLATIPELKRPRR